MKDVLGIERRTRCGGREMGHAQALNQKDASPEPSCFRRPSSAPQQPLTESESLQGFRLKFLLVQCGV